MQYPVTAGTQRFHTTGMLGQSRPLSGDPFDQPATPDSQFERLGCHAAGGSPCRRNWAASASSSFRLVLNKRLGSET